VSGRSGLAYNAKLGRHVRQGDPESLGVPTARLAVEALAAGDRDEAEALLRYMIEETERIYWIFSTWLTELRAYAEAQLDDADAEYRRLARALGCEPPLQQHAELEPRLAAATSAAIGAGDPQALEHALADVREALREVHDVQAEWCWALLTLLRDRLGEDRMDEVLRVTEEDWVTARYAALAELSPHELFELTIEGMRGHLTGPGRVGAIDVVEDDEKFVLSFDPCGSGGRMRRGDPERGQPPAAERPELFGATERAHDWSWQRKDVCIYCAHCAVVNEILPIERLGKPMRVTDNPVNPGDSCRWTIYKSAEHVPESAYRRVGKTPPRQPGGAAA
jgi:hypothetical protein